MNRRTLMMATPLLFLPKVAFARNLRKASGGSSFIAQQINTRDSIGGSLTNGYGLWQFGPGMTRGTSSGPPGPFGIFCYVKLNGKIIDRNSFGEAQQLVLDSGGNIYALSQLNDRWQLLPSFHYAQLAGDPNIDTMMPLSYNPAPPSLIPPFIGTYWLLYWNYYAQFVGSPNVDLTSSLINNPPPPMFVPPDPATYSPDGTSISSAPGTLINVDGVYSNGAGGASWTLLLNGRSIGNSPVTEAQINAHGQLFYRNGGGEWDTILNYVSYRVGLNIPASIPTQVTITPNPALIITPPNPTITPSTSIGTVVGSISVLTSDGSPYTGGLVLNVSPSASFFDLSGTDIVTTGVPDTIPHFIIAQATIDGNANIYSGASTVETQVT